MARGAVLPVVLAMVAVVFGPIGQAQAAETCTTDVFRYKVVSSTGAEVAWVDAQAKRCFDETGSLTENTAFTTPVRTNSYGPVWEWRVEGEASNTVQSSPSWRLIDNTFTLRDCQPHVDLCLAKLDLHFRASITPQAKPSVIATLTSNGGPTDAYKVVRA